MHARSGAGLAALATLILAIAPGSPAVGPADAVGLTYTVAIAATGGGSGRVQSTDAQFVPDGIIDCPMVRGIVDTTLCSHKYTDTTDAGGVVVYIRATPDPGSELCDENGCTTGVRQRSRFFTASGTFTEAFNLLVYDIHLSKAGSGSGRITSDPPYLDCGTECETSLESGEQLVFTAKPDPGSKFSKWTGACAGQNATCEITLTGDLTTSATFTAVAAATAEPTPEPTESPVATSSPLPTVEPPTSVPTILPTAAPGPTAESTLDPVPTTTDGGTGPVVILLAILLVVLLGGLGVVVARSRRGAA